MNYTPRFEFEDDRRDGVMDRMGGFFISLGPRYVFGALALVLIILGAIIYGLYPGSNENSGNVPIIRADAQPFKVSPDDPGGMEIANRDSTIFDAMSGNDADAGVENLLAETDTEEPMPRSQLFAGLNTDAPVEEEAEDMTLAEAPPQPDAIENEIENIARGVEAAEEPQLSEDIASAATAADEAEAAAATEPAAGAMEDVLEAARESAPEAVPEERPVAVQPSVDMNEAAGLVNQLEPAAGASPPRGAIPSGDYYVQVASVTDRSGTEKEWSKLTKKYEALDGFKYRVHEANLGERGTYYRIQAGPTTKEFANSTCGKIKDINPNGCLVVKK